ncbi:MAG TPA: DNA-binding response regulator [Bacteroidales bacterium]|jgi:DNA-binding LytR/AlgR family response regulator|nr:DNA-binding response regulator [Bacteroidales bacterium]HBZ21075.1 DNA-binding response regulator [Bacteroidales bacterium]
MIQCIAIDDEPLALQQIAGYIRKTPFLDLKAEFDSAIKAVSFLQENEIDLMFVDINMPDMNGLDFVKSQSHSPKVIFTTAYSEYAIEGFKVNALDYLLKPIDYDIFLKSANKALEWFSLRDKKSTRIESNDKFLFIKSEYKVLRINLSDIKYIEGMREYVRINMTSQKPIMTIISMKRIEEFLPQDKFMRVHRSYIVNLEKITTIERNRIVFDNNTYIPVSGQYNLKFQEYLNKNFLI